MVLCEAEPFHIFQNSLKACGGVRKFIIKSITKIYKYNIPQLSAFYTPVLPTFLWKRNAENYSTMFYHVYTTTVPIHTHTLFADNSLIHGKCSRFYLLKPYMYHITNKSLFKYDCNHVSTSLFIDLMVSVLNILWQIKIKASVMKMTNLLFIVRNCINDILLRARYTRYTSVRCIMTKNIVNRILVS